MPIYKIYDEHLVSVIFEVEASSKEEAKSKFMKEDREIVYVGETDYEPTGNITVVLNERGWWTMNRSEARFQEKLQKYKGKKRIEKRFRFRITKASNTGKTKRYSHQNFEARWTMPVYDFLIRCTECNGEGEYQLSLNPSSPIYKCGYCSEGYIEVVESFDCERDLRLDYPDAVDIIAEETEEI